MLKDLKPWYLWELRVTLEAIRQQISSAVDIIIHLSRLRDHSRKTMEISEVMGIKKMER